MVPRRFYTIMIIPDARARIRTILVGRRVVCLALGLLVAAMFGVGLLSREYLLGRASITEMTRQVGELKQAAISADRAKQLAEDMQRMKMRVSEVGKRTGLIETMIGLDGEVAVGGPDSGRGSDAFSRFYKKQQKELLTELADELGVLGATLDRQASRADSLLSYLDKHKRLLSSIPSITPVQGGWLSSGFGTRIDPFTHRRAFHYGVDIACPRGTPILATADGVVTDVEWCSDWGYVVELEHGNGFSTWYAHCSKIIAERGAQVRRGDVIALIGSTGRSTGPHLHYEVRLNDRAQNPIHYMLDRE